jgi:hypothetical protein
MTKVGAVWRVRPIRRSFVGLVDMLQAALRAVQYHLDWVACLYLPPLLLEGGGLVSAQIPSLDRRSLIAVDQHRSTAVIGVTLNHALANAATSLKPCAEFIRTAKRARLQPLY